MVETVITAIEDRFEFEIKKYFKKREILVLIVCAGLFLLSLPNLCPVYFIKIVNKKCEYCF